MLTECESRALAISMEVLLNDFEPKDATPYMRAENIFTEDHVEAILYLAQRKLRVEEFIRCYRRKAESLQPLIIFFKENKQPHLAALIERNCVLKADERPLISEEQLKSKLLHSDVPMRPVHYIRRECLLLSLKNTLADLSSKEQFWLVVHGMAGCGKTILAADVLLSYPELLSRCFENVVWLSGNSCKSVESLPSWYENFFAAFSDAVLLSGREVTHLHSQARKILLDKPNTLVVLDNVVFEDCVRWFDRLQCRILATSRNLEIFQAASGSVFSFPVIPNGFNISEISDFLSSVWSCDALSIPGIAALRSRLYSQTKGLPALVNIMASLSEHDPESVSWLCSRLEKGPLSLLDRITSYRFSNLEEAIRSSFDELSAAEKDFLCCMVVFPTDIWIPVQVVDLIAPVDVPDPEGSVFETLHFLEKLVKRSLIDGRKVAEGDGCPYEYRVHPVMGNFLTYSVDNEHLSRTGLLLSRMEDFLESFPQRKGHKKVKSFFKSYANSLKEKSFSCFTDEIPSLEEKRQSDPAKRSQLL